MYYKEAINCKKYKYHNLTEKDIRQKMATSIYSIRRFKNITQADLAQKIGVCPAQMLNYENHTKIPIYRLDAICKALDINLIQILEHCMYDKPLINSLHLDNYIQL